MRSETVPPPSATCPGEGSPRGGSLSSAHTAWKEAGVPPRPDRRHDPELILRVNREYHDVEGSAYDERHDEIFIEEVARWQGVGRELLEGKPERLEVLDVGTGTGFVPLQVARFLKPGDRFVCSDISARILECCERAVGRAGPRCALEFVQVDGRRYPFEGGRFDLVTLNSVVHHLPEFAPFFREIDRILRPGGRIAIAHEPNRRFYGHPLLWRSSRILTALLQPWQGAVAAMRTLRIDRALKALRLHALLRRATHQARGRRVRAEVRSHEE
ncbi:MAG: methyltransferase domain-containing protein, partial [Planctomycetota bacterium]